MTAAAEALTRLSTPFIDTRTSQRRAVVIASFDDLARETDRVEAASQAGGEGGGVRVTGNWSAGQILEHIGRTIEKSMDGFVPGTAGAVSGAGFVGRLAARARRSRAAADAASLKALLLRAPMSPGMPGVGAPGELEPAANVWTPDGAARLRVALQRIRDKHPMDKPSPACGPMSPEDWAAFHLRHAALHLSYIILGEWA